MKTKKIRLKQILVTGLMMVFVTAMAWAQEEERYAIPQIGDDAPAFVAESTNGTVHFPNDFGKSWKVILCHPKDYTPVCSSELLELAQLQDDFKELNTEIIIVSTDHLESHKTWKKVLEEIDFKDSKGQKIYFPLVADQDRAISKKYGMIHNRVSTTKDVRGVYIVGPENKIEATVFYPMSVGRNMDELKRAVTALQEVEKNEARILTPANWNPGDDVLLPYLSKEDKKALAVDGSNVYELTWFMQYKKQD